MRIQPDKTVTHFSKGGAAESECTPTCEWDAVQNPGKAIAKRKSRLERCARRQEVDGGDDVVEDVEPPSLRVLEWIYGRLCTAHFMRR